MTISKELQAQWVAALRSGEYKQGEAQMRMVTEEGELAYCCLGVLCEITPGVEWSEKYYGYGKPGYDHANGLPPHLNAFAIGLNYLAHLNDTGFTFDQIADVIENGHLAYFHGVKNRIVELPDWSKE